VWACNKQGGEWPHNPDSDSDSDLY